LTKGTMFEASQSPLIPPLATTPTAPQAKAPENDLFSLDFRAPPVSTASSPEPKKDVKQDILSLFSSNSVATANPTQIASTTLHNSLNWQGTVPQQQSTASTSMIGTTGSGMWGASSGWTGPVTAVPPQPNIWNTPTPAAQSNIFDTNSIWGGTATSNTPTTTTTQDLWASSSAAPKKDEVFGDIWGSFK
jgi:stromal membrane-associated protein